MELKSCFGVKEGAGVQNLNASEWRTEHHRCVGRGPGVEQPGPGLDGALPLESCEASDRHCLFPGVICKMGGMRQTPPRSASESTQWSRTTV